MVSFGARPLPLVPATAEKSAVDKRTGKDGKEKARR